MTPAAVIFALVIGLTLGLLGAGGSAITVPVFVYALGMAPKEAIASSLPVVGAVSLVGAIRHKGCGNLDLRAAALFAPSAMAGAYSGARLAGRLSGTAQMAIFAVVMLTAACLMYRDSAVAGDLDRTVPESKPRVWLLVVVGTAVGVMTGLVGVGGGFLIVPAVVLLAGVPMRTAVGTSLAVIAANSAAGFAGYIDQIPIQWGLISGFAAIAAAGIFLGAGLVKHVSQAHLRRGFAVFLAAVAIFILGHQAASRPPAPAAAQTQQK